jgi:hypothetical protein
MKKNVRSSLGNKSLALPKGFIKQKDKFNRTAVLETFKNEKKPIDDILSPDDMNIISSAYKPGQVSTTADRKTQYTKERIETLKKSIPSMSISDYSSEDVKHLKSEDDDDNYIISPRNEIDIFFGDGTVPTKKTINYELNASPFIGTKEEYIRDQTWIYCHERTQDSGSKHQYKATFNVSPNRVEATTNMTGGRRRLLNIIDQNSKGERTIVTKNQKLEDLDSSIAAQRFRDYLMNKSKQIPDVLE